MYNSTLVWFITLMSPQGKKITGIIVFDIKTHKHTAPSLALLQLQLLERLWRPLLLHHSSAINHRSLISWQYHLFIMHLSKDTHVKQPGSYSIPCAQLFKSIWFIFLEDRIVFNLYFTLLHHTLCLTKWLLKNIWFTRPKSKWGSYCPPTP